jgi:putative transposase
VSEKYELIDTEKATLAETGDTKYTITAMCEWLDVSTSGYYEWVDRPDSATTRRRQVLALLGWPQRSRNPTRPTATAASTPS